MEVLKLLSRESLLRQDSSPPQQGEPRAVMHCHVECNALATRMLLMLRYLQTLKPKTERMKIQNRE